jgi:hypothetical protein
VEWLGEDHGEIEFASMLSLERISVVRIRPA